MKSNSKKIRIAILGIGGIGGYLGGKLAHHYAEHDQIEIIFITRGAQLQTISEKGLEWHSNEITYRCKPHVVASNPREIGLIDILILTTKSFAAAEAIREYAHCISGDTTVLTTQNTITGRTDILPFLPEGALLMEGAIYISSSVQKPGKVVHLSGPGMWYFGTNNTFTPKGEQIAKILNYANINAQYTTNTEAVLWKKFLFASPAAVVTALFDITFVEITESQESEYLYLHLTDELMQLARNKNIPVDDQTILHNITLLTRFKGEAKSSFLLDLKRGKPTEIKALVLDVIAKAQKHQISIPYYQSAYAQLQLKYPSLTC
ncbi:ketopantoate reductase family protein [Flavobacterium sp.]|uniref:ketopantoate reductase family protein n=1 Tax=Flavobacterium sp. TaxID=239 RepID=UPI002FDDDA79